MKTRTIQMMLVALLVFVTVSSATPLDDYVAQPDPSYSYEVVTTIDHPQGKVYVIKMTSQTWRSESEVNRTVWQHWLTIIVPLDVASDTALLWINGGSNDRPAPARPDGMLVEIALQSETVVADLRMVPNQPLVFADDPDNERYEDAIIAYTFDKFLNTGDATWPLLLPMVKSAVRAMDTVQDHIAKIAHGSYAVNDFVVSGGSKRGWTTWLTAAVDKRVLAIAPIVIDVLNMGEQMKHHYGAYGFYSSAIGDYEDMNVLGNLDSEAGADIRNFVDPYEYRERYPMPKFLINSSGDQFFLPDSAQFYFDDLPDDKYLLYCPNTDHGLDGSDADSALLAWYASLLAGRTRPDFDWEIPEPGHMKITARTQPLKVTLWTATNPEARDFRLETIGAVWQSKELKPERTAGARYYDVKVPAPEKGWTAYFVELLFDSDTPIPFRFSTEVRVVPDVLPFAEKADTDTN
ncbi:MAG: PhoPQ-activated pathogenicity-related family protein [Phycisphaerales bacterium]|nr:MAG: PhoPQ-activated pathogenicity-related family protein [Phycisphaerales bacterium]